MVSEKYLEMGPPTINLRLKLNLFGEIVVDNALAIYLKDLNSKEEDEVEDEDMVEEDDEEDEVVDEPQEADESEDEVEELSEEDDEFEETEFEIPN